MYTATTQFYTYRHTLSLHDALPIFNAGTLFIGGGGTTGSVVSSIFNNFGTLGFNRSNSLTYAGTIVGTGAVNQVGAGTTTLTGNNSYTGATTISAGTLRINGDQSAATGQIGRASCRERVCQCV